MSVYFYLILLAGLLFIISVQCDTDSTNLLLRRSVEFSQEASYIFLDLIRGEASIHTTAEILERIRSFRMHDKFSLYYIAPVFKHYRVYVIFMLIGLSFTIFMPIIGIFFCCLRCCGLCGGRVLLMEHKRDPCLRITCSVLLAIFVTFQLAAVVLCFINNHLQQEALISQKPQIGMFPQLKESLSEIVASIDEIMLAVKNSTSQIPNEQQKDVYKVVSDVVAAFNEDLKTKTNLSRVLSETEQLQNVIRKYGGPLEGAELLRQFTLARRSLLENLPNWSQSISDILNTKCTQVNICREYLQITKTSLVANFDTLQFQEDAVNKLLATLKDAQDDATNLDQLRLTLDGMDDKIKEIIKPKLDDKLIEFYKSLVISLDTLLNQGKDYISRFGLELDNISYNENSPLIIINEYLLYMKIALLCLPLLIVLFFYFGLCFGVCGDRPYEEAGLCNRGVGANLLMAGVYFIFIFSGLLMLVCVGMFLVGGLLQTELCRYLTRRYPDGPRIIDDSISEITQVLHKPLPTDFPNRTVKSNTEWLPYLQISDSILSRCSNLSLMDAFGANPVRWIINDESINEIFDNILKAVSIEKIDTPFRDSISSVRVTMEKFKSVQYVDFSTAISQCDKPLTKIADINNYIDNLRRFDIPELSVHISRLHQDFHKLHGLMNSSKGIFSELQLLPKHYAHLRLGLEAFSADLDHSLQGLVLESINDTRPQFLLGMRTAIIATWRNISCRNLNAASVKGVNSICYTFLGPMNGFWAGLGLCILLSIPSLFCAIKLASLYRKTEKYSPDYVEPDYISYHGFYMRPSTEGSVPKQRKSSTRNKLKGPRRGKVPGEQNAFGFNRRHRPANNLYHPVSVYPYDTYE